MPKPRRFFRSLSLMLGLIAGGIGAVAQTGTSDAGVWDVPRTGGDAITEPSPEATAMRRYQDYPISYATGTADISIPLVGLQSGDLSVSLGISYHTGGIKKTDIPTGVGLGWTLTGLGSVSRQINGFPDEWRGNGQSVTHDIREDYMDFDYLKSIIEARTDAEYDVYSYNLPGYSGKFIIRGESIVELPQSDLRINRIYSHSNPAATEAFVITTPEGIKYTFDVTEEIEFAYYPAPLPTPFYDQGYKAVSSWQLSSIQSVNSPEVITVEYTTMGEWTRDNNKRLYGMSMSYTLDPIVNTHMARITDSEDSPSGLCSTIFKSQRLPKKISSRSGTIDLTIGNDGKRYGYNPHDFITAISLKDLGGNEIRKVELVNDKLFTDGRRRLDEVKVTSDNIVTDRYSFDYHDTTPTMSYDAFGYANGVQNGLYESIIDSSLKISKYRATNSHYLTCNSLKSIREISGIETSIEYEPSTINLNGSPDYSVFCGYVTIGLRIRNIRTKDPITGRERVRSFSYADPLCSITLSMLSPGEFINQGGSRNENQFPGFPDNYSMGITLSASAKTKGLPAESAVIYYGSVTEDLTGTDINRPLRTRYEYDLDNVRHIMNTVGKEFSIDADYTKGPFHTPGHDNNFLGSFENYFITDLERKLAHYHPTRFNIEELIGASPLLKTKTEYEYLNGAYKERKIERSYYSHVDRQRILTGIFGESVLFKYTPLYQPPPDFLPKTLTDLNYGPMMTNCVRHVLDSVVTTTCYPDVSGTPGRTMTTRYLNGRGNLEATPGFYINPSLIPEGKTFYPLGSTVSCGGESISQVTIPGEFAMDIDLQNLATRGCRRVPSIERWIVRTPEGSDSVYRRYLYSRLPIQGSSYIRPREVSVEVNTKTVPTHQAWTNGDYVPDTISIQRYSAYDARGRIAGMTDAEGKRIEPSWDANYDLLTSMSLPDVGLSSSYTYRPLVGCTSITVPSGKKRQFGYEAGRLVSEKNTAGDLVASYSYELYGSSQNSDGFPHRNLFTTTVHDDSGEATQSTLYDGFGMPVRTLSTVAGGSLVSASTTYDALDRPVRQYLPVPAADIDDTPDASAWYGDANPYKSLTYRNLASDKPLSVIAEGQLMQSHPARAEYLCNSATDPMLRCIRLRLANNPDRETVTTSGYYPAGALDVTRSTDPDGHVALTFTDWRGFKILERKVLGNNEFADVHYLYDPMGRLRVAIQPEGMAKITSTTGSWSNTDEPLDKFSFINRYDRRGNCTYTLTPGGGPVEMRYDRLNRLAFRATATMQADHRCEFYLYDAINRPVVTGIADIDIPAVTSGYTATATFSPSLSGLDSSGYTPTDAQLAGILNNPPATLVNYYDSYDCLQLSGFSDLTLSDRDAEAAKGNLVATREAIFSADSHDYRISDSAESLYTTYNYDTEGRVTETASTTAIPGVTTRQTSTYTRQGKPLTTTYSVIAPDSTYTLTTTTAYDPTGAPLSASATMRNASVVKYEYNQLGQLSYQNFSLRNNISYGIAHTYNLRGNLAITNSPYFVQVLKYEDGTTPCYNGNISEMTIGYEPYPRVTRTFKYDNANRLTAMVGSDGNNTAYSYNLNSSPLTIERYGLTSLNATGLIDDLSLNYDGNRLKKVDDAAETVILEGGSDFGSESSIYHYDSDGRLTGDTGRQIRAITYSPTDNPLYIQSSENKMLAEYTYGASGQKLSKRLGSKESFALRFTPTRYYIGPFEFTSMLHTGLQLSRVNLAWGYFDASGDEHIYIPDYQGNIRQVIDADGFVEQQTDYYPYGLPMATSNTLGAEKNQYKYGGKEYETENSLNQYDFEARILTPSLCQFTTPDPLAHKTPDVSPYLYCAADPINFIDPTGMDSLRINPQGYVILHDKGHTVNDVIEFIDEKGNVIETDGKLQKITKPYGTIVNVRKIPLYGENGSRDSSDKQEQADIIEVRGDEDATDIYEMYANNVTGASNVEVGLAKTGETGDKGHNFITCGHRVNAEPGITSLYNIQLIKGYTIRELRHSHGNTKAPSHADLEIKFSIMLNCLEFGVPMPISTIYFVPDKTIIKY